MKTMLFLLSLLMLTSCFNNTAEYSVKKPTNGKYHAIIMIKGIKKNTPYEELNQGGGQCTAFVISDTTALTAGHCMGVTQYSIDKELKPAIKEAKKELKMLSLKLADLRANCVGFQCLMIEAQILEYIEMTKRGIAMAKLAKPDQFKVLTLDGKDTKVVVDAYYKGNRRDFGFLKGDFKKFNKLPVAQGFNVLPGDILKACGYVGSKYPPACINYEAVGQVGFEYAGNSMFVPGISGGPVLDQNGHVVGIASAARGPYSIITPMLGVVQLIEK